MSILNIKFDLVEVTWDDASSLEHGWVDPNDEKPQPQLVKTVGFLVNESEHYLVIASTTDGNWVNGRFQIPRGMVRSCKPLRRKRTKKESGLATAAAAVPPATVPAPEVVAHHAGEARPIEPKPAAQAVTPAEPAALRAPAAQAVSPAIQAASTVVAQPTVLEDLLAKAGEAASALKKTTEPAMKPASMAAGVEGAEVPRSV